MNDDHRDDPTDDRIKELLDSAAPDQPDLPPTARTTSVRERAGAVRRRNRLVLAAAVVAVVGVGVGVPVLLSGDDPSDTQQVATDPGGDDQDEPTTVVEPAAPVVECPAEPPAIDDASGKADFPEGAASLRLCPATFDTAAGATEFTLPTEPVTEDVDAVLDALRSQPPFEIAPECASMMLAPMPWALVVGYDDGSTVTVGATLTGCASITVDGQEIDVTTALETIEAAVQAATPAAVAPPTESTTDATFACPPLDRIDALVATGDSYDGDLADFAPVTGAVCYLPDPMGAGARYAETEGVLTPDQLAVIADDLASRTTSSPTQAGRCTDTGPTRIVALEDADLGEVVRVDRSCTSEFAGGETFWLAGDKAEAVIAEALGGEVGG